MTNLPHKMQTYLTMLPVECSKKIEVIWRKGTWGKKKKYTLCGMGTAVRLKLWSLAAMKDMKDCGIELVSEMKD